MGIFEGLFGRRERPVMYRTIDGGHPAPFPDMTDEQLYNYETVFNVPHKTFDRPPRPAHRDASEAAAALEAAFARRMRAFDAPRYTARRAAAARQEEPCVQADDEERTERREQTEQAEQTEQTEQRTEPRPPPDKLPPPDLSKPVRLATTKQPVEIVTTRARHPVYKVHAYIGDDTVMTLFTLDGRLSENGLRYLENVPEEEPALYLNVYPNADGADRYLLTQHATRAEADAAARPGRIACVPLRIG